MRSVFSPGTARYCVGSPKRHAPALEPGASVHRHCDEHAVPVSGVGGQPRGE